MKSSSIVGIVLIILGALALAYQGITYTTQKKVLDIGPIQATKKSIRPFHCLQFLADWLWWVA